MAAIPAEYHDLFEKKSYAYLSTLMADGSPQVTPVWVGFDGEHVLVNSSRGRVKDRNMRRDGRVAILIQDPDSSYRWVQVRGPVAEITEEGAAEYIDKLAKRYLDVDKYPFGQPGEVRVLYKIRPDSVTAFGG